MDIGSRVRDIRKRHDLSQRKLAKRSGVSNGTISLIEQNKISPSVALLKRLMDVFGLSLSEFFAEEDPSREKRFFRADELSEYTSGGITFFQVGGNVPDRRLQILRERYQPAADTGEQMLGHAGEEGGIVLSGRIEITAGEETAILGAGDGYYFDSTLPHRFRNLGEEECEIVSVCTPPTF